MSEPAGISVVQMIQALRGCVQHHNQHDDHQAALKAQQTLVALDDLCSALRRYDDDMPYQPWPLICTESEIEAERSIREWQKKNLQEPQS